MSQLAQDQGDKIKQLNKPKDHPRWNKWLTTKAPATFDKVALVAAFLGVLIGTGAALTMSFASIGIYMIAFGVFHLLEFVITARFNLENLGMNSFLLTNGVEYAAAHAFALLEFFIQTLYFQHAASTSGYRLVLGILFVVAGQYVRSTAMIHAANSFNHYIQEEKKENHRLVTTGIYSLARHPSYFGFFVWEIGSQLILGNRVSLVLFTAVLYVYFTVRIKIEEKALIRFFGDEYLVYKKNVWSGLPFYR